MEVIDLLATARELHIVQGVTTDATETHTFRLWHRQYRSDTGQKLLCQKKNWQVIPKKPVMILVMVLGACTHRGMRIYA